MSEFFRDALHAIAVCSLVTGLVLAIFILLMHYRAY